MSRRNQDRSRREPGGDSLFQRLEQMIFKEGHVIVDHVEARVLVFQGVRGLKTAIGKDLSREVNVLLQEIDPVRAEADQSREFAFRSDTASDF